jgi:hypothetical protein
MKHHLRIAVMLLGILTCFISCQKDDFKEPVEETGESSVKFISLSDFSNKVEQSKDYKKLSSLFDINKLKAGNVQSRLTETDSATIATDDILMIEREDKIFYTFRIETVTDRTSFYNLLVVTNTIGDIDNVKIFEYIPSDVWLEDKSLPFSGHMKLHENDIFNENDLFARGVKQCITGIRTKCRCNQDNNHCGPAPGRTCTSWTKTVTAIYGPCPPEINNGEPIDTNDGSDANNGQGGGSGTGDGDPNNTNDCQPTIDNPCDDDETAVMPPKPQNTKTTHQKNCEELNKLTSPPGYNEPNPFVDDNHPDNTSGLNTNPRLAILSLDDDTILNYQFETGFSLHNRNNYPEYGAYAHYKTASVESHHLYFPTTISEYGTVHVHPKNATINKWIPMFSLDDIYAVLKIRDYYNTSSWNVINNPNGDSLFISILIANQAENNQTYAIKIDDITKFQKLKNIKENLPREWEKLNKELEDRYIEEASDLLGTADDYQKTLLKFINDYNLGVSLYQMEQTGAGTPSVAETWTKLGLSPAEEVIESGC